MAVRIVVRRNDFPAKPAAVRAAAGRGTLAAAGRIVADARTRYSATPGETGEMRDSTVARPTGATSAVAESTAEHAVYQNFGTRTVPATYFFTGAVENESQRFGPEMAAEVRGSLG